ncbi:MAG: ATP-binding cassette domain-containing protein [Deltaproteobacteria bacterium]|nr:ATP-binding cassette domain-containing protein [Deltaproteobacteria bacterium]
MNTRLQLELTVTLGTFSLSAALRLGDEPLALIGPNGAGKTSLLLAIAGLLTPETGTLSLGDAKLFDRAQRVDVPTEARAIAYMPQDDALFPHLSALGNVEFAVAARHPAWTRAQTAERAHALLKELEATPLAPRKPAQLSGGERQKIALVRALGAEPRALLLDEPLAALDATARRQVRAFLFEHVAALKLPALVVTHDPDDVRALGGRVAALEAGRVIQTGSLDELRAAPKSPFIAQFAGATGAP